MGGLPRRPLASLLVSDEADFQAAVEDLSAEERAALEPIVEEALLQRAARWAAETKLDAEQIASWNRERPAGLEDQSAMEAEVAEWRERATPMLGDVLRVLRRPGTPTGRGNPRPVPHSLTRDLEQGRELMVAPPPGTDLFDEVTNRPVDVPFSSEEAESRTCAARDEALVMWAEQLVRMRLQRKRDLHRARFADEYQRRTGQGPIYTSINTRHGPIRVSASWGNPSPEVERARVAGLLPPPGKASGGALEPVPYRWIRAAAEHLHDDQLAAAWALADIEHSKLLDAKSDGFAAAREAALKAIAQLRSRAGC